jgi:7,8-dihydroneopterin aldolase/epimerase/oxygenase
MALIALEDMRFYAYHGLYEEERILGTHFILDIFIETDITSADTIEEHGMDKLINTINYETVYDICKIQMREENSEKLLETVLHNIIDALKKQFSTIQVVRVKIKKLNPPMSGQIGAASIEITDSFIHECPKCNNPLICYDDDTCWCMQEKLKIHPRTYEMVTTQFKDCLCAKCLGQYAG